MSSLALSNSYASRLFSHDRALAVSDNLSAQFPERIISRSPSSFEAAQKSYWNRTQQEKSPQFFFQPVNTEQVQIAIAVIRDASCAFAIEGGGHSAHWAGSCVQDAIQIDLAKLDHVEIAPDRRTLRVGPGVNWGQLYPILEKEWVMAVGGRDAGVGVPGFVFGGGLSNLGSLHGWGVDNLVNASIVLADGRLVQTSLVQNSDLFRAICGGGAHNYGIVTDLTLKLHPYKGMWGGLLVIAEEHFDAVFAAHAEYTKSLVQDGKAHVILDIAPYDTGSRVALLTLAYPEPIKDPPIFTPFRAIPAMHETLRFAHNSELAEEVAQVTDSRGKRNSYWTQALEYDEDVVRSLYEIWGRTIRPYEARYRSAFDLNNLTPAHTHGAFEQGRKNVYALEACDKPMANVLVTMVWEHASDDEEITGILRKIGSLFEDELHRRSKHHRFKYMNYANQNQDVIGSFGEENKRFLLQTAGKYDPEEVFQTLQVGGFKLEINKHDFYQRMSLDGSYGNPVRRARNQL